MPNHPHRRFTRPYVDRLARALGKTVSRANVQQADGYVRKVWVATGAVGPGGMAPLPGTGCATLAELGQGLEAERDQVERFTKTTMRLPE